MIVFNFHSIVIPFISGMWGRTGLINLATAVSKEFKNVLIGICLTPKLSCFG